MYQEIRAKAVNHTTSTINRDDASYELWNGSLKLVRTLKPWHAGGLVGRLDTLVPGLKTCIQIEDNGTGTTIDFIKEDVVGSVVKFLGLYYNVGTGRLCYASNKSRALFPAVDLYGTFKQHNPGLTLSALATEVQKFKLDAITFLEFVGNCLTSSTGSGPNIDTTGSYLSGFFGFNKQQAMSAGELEVIALDLRKSLAHVPSVVALHPGASLANVDVNKLYSNIYVTGGELDDYVELFYAINTNASELKMNPANRFKKYNGTAIYTARDTGSGRANLKELAGKGQMDGFAFYSSSPLVSETKARTPHAAASLLEIVGESDRLGLLQGLIETGGTSHAALSKLFAESGIAALVPEQKNALNKGLRDNELLIRYEAVVFGSNRYRAPGNLDFTQISSLVSKLNTRIRKVANAR